MIIAPSAKCRNCSRIKRRHPRCGSLVAPDQVIQHHRKHLPYPPDRRHLREVLRHAPEHLDRDPTALAVARDRQRQVGQRRGSAECEPRSRVGRVGSLQVRIQREGSSFVRRRFGRRGDLDRQERARVDVEAQAGVKECRRLERGCSEKELQDQHAVAGNDWKRAHRVSDIRERSG